MRKLLGLFLIAFFVWWMVSHTDQTTETIQSTPAAVAEVKPEPVTPEDYVRDLKEFRNAEVRVESGVAYVRYDIQPWSYIFGASSAEGVYGLHLAKVVPKLFEKFPDLTYIKVTAYASFRDKKGNDSVQDALSVVFSRSNSDSIRWNKIAYSDVPSLADDFWKHPGFR